jgi:C1A family cysteine protease
MHPIPSYAVYADSYPLKRIPRLPDLFIVVGETSYAPYKEWHGAYYFEDPTVLVISYGVTNRGTATSNATESSVSINDVLFDTQPVPPLAPGGTVTISLKNWTPDANKNRVVIHNDPGDLVSESDEYNHHTYYWYLCLDGKRNGQETGVDCGGDYCYPCSLCDPATPLPERFDWRDFNYMTWVRDQGSCGSCWAFASVGAMEGLYSKEQRSNLQLNLAEADLVLCSGAGSCDGGSPWDASDYIRDHGIVNETCLPYQGRVTCADKCVGPDSGLWRISQIRGVVNDIDERKRAVACRGPLLAYGDGHCVVIAGYDGDAWIIKNSWGSGWGDQGYATVPFDESNWTVSVAWMGGVYYDE